MLWYSSRNESSVSWLLIRAIHIYRRLIPSAWKRCCLFRESCSLHVERMARDEGAWAALVALWRRGKACRPGYSFIVDAASRSWVMQCRDGSRHRQETLAESARQEGAALADVTPAAAKTIVSIANSPLS